MTMLEIICGIVMCLVVYLVSCLITTFICYNQVVKPTFESVWDKQEILLFNEINEKEVQRNGKRN